MAFYPAIPASDGTSMEARENSEFQVFEVYDTARATPLRLLSTAGTNAAPLVTTAQGVVPPVEVVSPNVSHVFKSGAWEWRRDSFDGAEVAVKEARNAAGVAASAAMQVQFKAEAGEFKGEPGPEGEPGTPGAPGVNAVPAQAAVAEYMQTPSSPVRQAMREAIGTAEEVTSKVAKGELIKNVRDPKYGAKGDGVADDTAAFHAALADGVAVYAPAGKYLTRTGIVVPAYKSLYGEWSRAYTGAAGSGARIIAASPAMTGAVLKAGDGSKIAGVSIQGAGKASNPQHDGLLLGKQSIIAEVTISHARHGINCAYSNGAVITMCQIHDNSDNGIHNPLDSIIIHNTINVNGGSGIYSGTGGNDCSITHNKVEWNAGHGIALFQCKNLNVLSNVIDRNGKTGLRAVECKASTIGPNIVRRNGKLSQQQVLDDVNVYTQGNEGVIFFGQHTATGGDDANTGGGGYISPTRAFYEQDNRSCSFIGNNYGGGVSAARKTVGVSIGNTHIGNLNFPGVQAASAQSSHIGRVSGFNIAAAGKLSEAFRTNEITTSSFGTLFELTVACRSNLGNKYAAVLAFQVSREGGAAVASNPVVTTINGAASAIAVDGSVVAVQISPAADGSSLSVVLTNASTAAVSMEMTLKER